MATETTAAKFIAELKRHRSAEEVAKYQRYFKFDQDRQDPDDTFIGVRMGQVFALAKEYLGMPIGELEKLLESPVHEVRVGAVSIMDWEARRKRTPAERRRELFELYLRRHDRINGWDLVDRSAPHVVGGYLGDKPRDALYQLARSPHWWERRTAIVSTAFFLKQGELEDTFKIAEILLQDGEPMVQKATGWMLREAGRKDPERLRRFLDRHASAMPRTTLRQAIEHLDAEQRERYRAR
jgi:hypothetical protein